MKINILGIIALSVLGACTSEPKDEVGRYVPITPNDNFSSTSVLDTKTGVIYRVWMDLHRGAYRLQKINPIQPDAKTAAIFFKEDTLFNSNNYK